MDETGVAEQAFRARRAGALSLDAEAIAHRPQMTDDEIREILGRDDLTDEQVWAVMAYHVPKSWAYQGREFDEAKARFVRAVTEAFRPAAEKLRESAERAAAARPLLCGE